MPSTDTDKLNIDLRANAGQALAAQRLPTIIDVHVGEDEWRDNLKADALAGLTATPKSMPPTWFYDDLGSMLFDQITRLPEYYLTRAERSILEAHAGEIIDLVGALTIVELGSGTSEKTRLILDAARDDGRAKRFVPFDVSEGVLRQAADEISAQYPGIAVHAVVGDFHRHLRAVPTGGTRLFLFLGSTIGNFGAEERAVFLKKIADAMDPDDFLLLGTDLQKDPARLVAAYDDAQGISADFNRNLLRVMNNALEADFDAEAFTHVARYNADAGQMEMRLVPAQEQCVRIGELDLDVVFAAGEEMLTEISAKFTPAQVDAELLAAGLRREHSWTDVAGDFQLTLARKP